MEHLCPSCAFNKRTPYPDFKVGVFKEGTFREIENIHKISIDGSVDKNGNPDFAWSARVTFHGKIDIEVNEHIDIIVNGVNQGTYFVGAIRWGGTPTPSGQHIATTTVELVGIK